MSVRYRIVLGVVLVVIGVAIHAFRMFVPPSELAQKGSRALGQVLYKDSRPAGDGEFTYTVTFVFPDANQRNYQVTRVVPNKSVWDRLKSGAEVRVMYMPDRPEEASIEGAEELVRPHDAAYAYMAWTAIVAGLVVLGLAFRDSSPGAETKVRGGGR